MFTPCHATVVVSLVATLSALTLTACADGDELAFNPSQAAPDPVKQPGTGWRRNNTRRVCMPTTVGGPEPALDNVCTQP